jgi:hypothetical protein
MVEHIRNGGRPYDARGQHIVAVVEELNVLSRFRRANHGKIFEGNTAALITETNTYYETLNRVLKGLSSHRGYTNYFESWNPAEVTEQDVIIENIKSMFVRQDIDTRIEQALPILARISQQGHAMKEANIFESWANKLMEGTWAMPDTPEKKEQLVVLLSKELPVGADATNATEQLYDLVGDDVLFDQLETLADQDADADARGVVIARLQELGNDPDVAEVLTALDLDTDTPADAEDTTDQISEDDDVSPVESAILRRIKNSHDDLVKQYGEPAVMAAARDVADDIGDVEEIGSSDVSAYVNRVVQSLADGSYADLSEGMGGSYFVVFDDGREPYGPIDQHKAQTIAQRMAGAEVIPARDLVKYQQDNRRQAMKGSEPMEADNLSTFEEGRCNMTAEGTECPKHGRSECWTQSAQDTGDNDMLSRLKALSGIISK